MRKLIIFTWNKIYTYSTTQNFTSTSFKACGVSSVIKEKIVVLEMETDSSN